MISRHDITPEKDIDVAVQANSACELVLLYPCDSLYGQVVEEVGLCQRASLVTVTSTRPGAIRRAAAGAALVLVDVTEQICQAMAALDELAPILEPQRLAVYTERMHEGLERFVRVRGILLLLGPLEHAHWRGLLHGAGLDLARRQTAKVVDASKPD
jgi:hypothetical protein